RVFRGATGRGDGSHCLGKLPRAVRPRFWHRHRRLQRSKLLRASPSPGQRTRGERHRKQSLAVRNAPYFVEAPEGSVKLVDADGSEYDLKGKPASRSAAA